MHFVPYFVRLAMQSYKDRPLTRHEILIRLLFEHADEVIKKLEFLNESANKLEHLELMINGFDGAPGLIEVVEALTYEINRVERRVGRSSSLDMTDISHRLARAESILDKVVGSESVKQGNQKINLGVGRKITALMWVASLLGLLNLSLFAWSIMV